MNGISIFIVLAWTSSPMPSENYGSWISPEIADTIQECVINGEYREYLDFNGDKELNMADVVSVRKRYQDNIRYGNEITLEKETVYDIVLENYTDELIYWEIDRINGQLCRQYELTVSEVTEAEIYVEFESYSDTIIVEINPFEETINVKDNEF